MLFFDPTDARNARIQNEIDEVIVIAWTEDDEATPVYFTFCERSKAPEFTHELVSGNGPINFIQ